MEFVLNDNQKKLLIEISRQRGKTPAIKLGRRVYQTAVSSYNNIIILKDMGLISMRRLHNMSIVELTQNGISYLTNPHNFK